MPTEFHLPPPPTTPVLVIDGAALDRNLQTMQALCDAAGVSLRAHGKMHKCSALAARQMDLGAVGVCAQTIGEAEAFAAAGIPDILVTAPMALHSAKRAAAIADKTRLAATADSPELIAALGEAARAAGATLGLVVDVDLGQHRTGCRPEDAPALAKLAAATEGLRYDGVQAYVGHLQHVADLAARKASNDEATRRLAALVSRLTEAGLGPRLVTGGGTGTHAYDLKGGVFNEIQAGSYALMDAEYDACGAPDGNPWPFAAAMYVAAQVVSTQHRTHVTIDAGLKAFSTDGPMPRLVDGAPKGALFRPMGDEHGAIFRAEAMAYLREARQPLGISATVDRADDELPPADDMPKLGDTVWLQPGHCDPTVNLYDAFLVWQDGRWTRWAIDARRVTPAV